MGFSSTYLHMLIKKASENQAPLNRHMSRLTSNQAPNSEEPHHHYDEHNTD